MKKTKVKKVLKCLVPIHAPNLDSIFVNRRDSDKAKVIINYLMAVRKRLKENPNFNPNLDRKDRWCPVYSPSLKSMIHDYKRIITILMENKIIEYKPNAIGGPSYFIGKYCILYRFCFPHHLLIPGTKKYRKEEIITETVIKSTLKYSNQSYDLNRKELFEKYPWFLKSFEFLKKLKIQPGKVLLKDGVLDELDYLQMTTSNFNNGLFKYISVDNFAGRVFSHLTNLTKVLREYLYLENSDEKLVIVDVKNAQPYLISMILKKPELLSYLPEFEPLYDRVAKYKDFDDVKLFFHLCSTGQLYEYLAQCGQLSREDVKERLVKHVLYCSNSTLKKDTEMAKIRFEIQNLFRLQFPNVFDFFIEVKKTPKYLLPFLKEIEEKREKKIKPFAILSLLGMRLEVEFLLKIIARHALQNKIELASIHDAFIFKESDLDKFILIFNSTFEALNVPAPTLDIKVLNQQH